MPVDLRTVDSGTPRTDDGRVYPEQLRQFESLDERLLPIVAALGRFTFDALGAAVPNAKDRSVLPRWLASAEWRALILRRDESMHGPREYELSDRGQNALRNLP